MNTIMWALSLISDILIALAQNHYRKSQLSKTEQTIQDSTLLLIEPLEKRLKDVEARLEECSDKNNALSASYVRMGKGMKKLNEQLLLFGKTPWWTPSPEDEDLLADQ